ncbi:MAG: hypothetical protein M3256_15045 [Actinomycetota bacterium]|nr:hypothetical protein [Actinomycetota bacterium]
MTESTIYVCFDLGATDDEVADVQAAFDAEGLDANVSHGAYAIVASAEVELAEGFVVLALSTTVLVFLNALGQKAGEDAWPSLKRLVSSLRGARKKDSGRIQVILRNEDHGPDIVIGPDVPDEALGRLLTEELPPAPSGTIVYDLGLGCWRDAASQK